MQAPVDIRFAERPTLVLGLMSGTSLDGLDLCAVDLHCLAKGQWTYRIQAAETVPYPGAWTEKLTAAFAKTREELVDLDRDYGAFLGNQCAHFCRRHALSPALIASHGHTVHHRPEDGYTLQIGAGQTLALQAQRPVVCNFRQLDVAQGGQGAPLVPVVDALLFGTYSQCLNLGGYANVSYQRGGHRFAYDITVVNALLNVLAQQLDLPYDAGGSHARRGQLVPSLFAELNALPFYKHAPPKSLGREWFETSVWPLVNRYVQQGAPVADLLHTANRHMATVIAQAIAKLPAGQVLVTGGGAYNEFLIESIQALLDEDRQLVLPEGLLIDFKEALAFALLGALRMRGEPNALQSVTGASVNTSGGDYFSP